MKIKNEHAFTMRFTKEQYEMLELIAKETYRNKTDALRFLVMHYAEKLRKEGKID